MKSKLLILLFVLLSTAATIAQTNIFPATGSVGIGTVTPDSSAALAILSSTKGILIPKITKTQRDAIFSPAVGLLIYQKNSVPGFYYYSGSAWVAVTPSSWNTKGNAGTNADSNFIGTTDAQALAFRVNNQKAGYIDYYSSKANTGFGYQSLLNNKTGTGNTANGLRALYFNTKGISNTASGASSLYFNTTGNGNTANSYTALYSNTSGASNVANGDNALYSNTTGGANTASGELALYSNTTGLSNVASGYYALYANTEGNYNTALGYGADVNFSNQVNSMALGYQTQADTSNTVRIGDGSITSIGGQVGWTNFSDGRIKKNIKENVPGLAFIKLLKPVTYNFDLTKEYELRGQKYTADWEGKHDIEKINFTGFVAQDVDAAAKKINYDFSGVDKRGKIMGFRYSEFVVPLVKAV